MTDLKFLMASLKTLPTSGAISVPGFQFHVCERISSHLDRFTIHRKWKELTELKV